ncbi:MAG TPA: alpha-L-fucosidase, partial [bacterium]
DFDTVNPANAGLYSPEHPADSPASPAFLKQWYERACEIADKYKPDLFYFDFEIAKPEFKDLRTQFLARYYNEAAKWKKPVVVTYKEQAYPVGAAVEDVERGMPAGIRSLPFEADTSVGWKSWCYVENESYKDVGFLLNNLIDVVSKNGTMLLNVGPKADGTIPDQSKDILLKIGDWLKVNGEAIYGTRPWLVSGEGPHSTEADGQIKEGDIAYGEGDVRYTLKGENLYIFILKPGLKPLSLRQMGKKAAPNLVVKGVTLLGSSEEVKWNRDDQGLVLEPPKTKPGDYVLVYKAALDGFALAGPRVSVKGYDLTVGATFQNYGAVETVRNFSLKIDGHLVTEAKVMVGSHSSETFTLSYTATHPALFRLSLATEGLYPLTGEAGIPAIDLTGEWFFVAGDSDQWQKPDFDDSTWEKQNLPAKWEAYGHHMDFSYGWYRKKVMIPAEWKGKAILLPLGKIDDADASYFNGHEVGGTGKLPPHYEGAWDKERHYEVPPQFIRYGQENEIAIRVYNAQGDAGLYAGPLGPIEVKR